MCGLITQLPTSTLADSHSVWPLQASLKYQDSTSLRYALGLIGTNGSAEGGLGFILWICGFYASEMLWALL